ncbi:MAG: hypothetical protein JOZ49_06895 [Mycolicibacterium sp.]|nr:hypothetical protein [Mycolicibacterium sp.]
MAHESTSGFVGTLEAGVFELVLNGPQHDFRLVNRTSTPKYEAAVTGEPAGRNPSMFRMGGGRSNSFEVVDGNDTVELDLFIAMQ